MAATTHQTNDPPQAIVIYDGECGVCQALTRWASLRNSESGLQFLPYQETDLEALSVGLTPAVASRSLVFLDAAGTRFCGARASIEMLRRLPGFWGAVGNLLSFPLFRALAEPAYKLFSRHRRAISRSMGLQSPDMNALDSSHHYKPGHFVKDE